VSHDESSPEDPFRDRAARYGTRVPTYRDPELALMMLEALALDFPIRALDLAAGQGDSSRHLRAIGAELTYLDRSAEMLQQGARRGLISQATSIRHNLSDLPLPFPPHSFDVVTIRYALHDIKDLSVLLEEIARILVVGGRLQLVDMCMSEGPALTFLSHLHSIKTLAEPVLVWIRTPDALTAQLTASGYEVTDTRWYASRVTSDEWIAEGQISGQRHEEMLELAHRWGSDHPAAAETVHLCFISKGFSLSIPVVILTARVPPSLAGAYEGGADAKQL
jgi:ubiquinone/menaquinone biosynthesis C-methylase UbiE